MGVQHTGVLRQERAHLTSETGSSLGKDATRSRSLLRCTVRVQEHRTSSKCRATRAFPTPPSSGIYHPVRRSQVLPVVPRPCRLSTGSRHPVARAIATPYLRAFATPYVPIESPLAFTAR